jgi:hypothetical protein
LKNTDNKAVEMIAKSQYLRIMGGVIRDKSRYGLILPPLYNLVIKSLFGINCEMWSGIQVELLGTILKKQQTKTKLLFTP